MTTFLRENVAWIRWVGSMLLGGFAVGTIWAARSNDIDMLKAKIERVEDKVEIHRDSMSALTTLLTEIRTDVRWLKDQWKGDDK